MYRIGGCCNGANKGKVDERISRCDAGSVEPVAKRLMNGLTDTTGSGSTETGSGSMETKSTGAVSTDADIMNVSPMREFGVGSLGVTAQRSVFTIRAGLRLTDTTVFGLGFTGMRSVGTVLQCGPRIGCSSPGWDRGYAHTNGGMDGDGVGVPLMGWWVSCWATGLRTRCERGRPSRSLGDGVDGVGVVELLGTTGLRPRASSTSAPSPTARVRASSRRSNQQSSWGRVDEALGPQSRCAQQLHHTHSRQPLPK